MNRLHFIPRPELQDLVAAEGLERVAQAYGFEVRAERMNVGYLGCINGYIKIPIRHPWFGLSYDAEGPRDVRVHGGLTYAEDHLLTPEGTIQGWWLGFDTNHIGDLSPSVNGLGFAGDTYRSMDYVMEELRKLAKQAREAQDDHD